MNHSPATRWVTSRRSIDLGDGPQIMGPRIMAILNVTPDSFSDGGRFRGVDDAVQHAIRMQHEGADMIDVGGESTRPGSDPVDADQERRRVVPVIKALADQISIPISIDTSKSIVAAEAIQAGAEIINDVTGLQGDPAMIDVARQSGAGICAMHMRGTPKTMQDNLSYDDVVEEVLGYLCQRRDWLLEAGVDHAKICLDPGIGFGKSHHQNLELMRQAERFHSTGCPILVGHSRKGFIAKLVGEDETSRDAGTVGGTLALAHRNIQIVRVHEVKKTSAALKIYRQCIDR